VPRRPPPQVNQASLSGEGKLELEGVRPLRHNAPIGSLVAGTPGAGAAPGAGGDSDPGADLLPSSGLLTSSEDYYPASHLYPGGGWGVEWSRGFCS
jgi:FKBP12-rapamycin complex-associated protein